MEFIFEIKFISNALRAKVDGKDPLSTKTRKLSFNLFSSYEAIYNIFTQKLPPRGHFGLDGTEITTV